MNDTLFIVIDNDSNVVGYTEIEDDARTYCEKENDKTYPYTNGYGVHYVPARRVDFKSK